jgi:hypothetical protein
MAPVEIDGLPFSIAWWIFPVRKPGPVKDQLVGEFGGEFPFRQHETSLGSSNWLVVDLPILKNDGFIWL